MLSMLPDIAYRIAIDRQNERIRDFDRGRPLHDVRRRGARELRRGR